MIQRAVRGVSSAVSSAVSSTVTSRVAKGAGRYEARALNLPSTNSPLAQKRFLGPVSALSSGSSQREAQQTGIKSGHVSEAVQDFGKLAKTPAAPLLERHPKSISPLVKDISTTFNGSLDQDLSHHNTIHQAGNVHWWRNALLATVMSNNSIIRDAFTPSSEINALLPKPMSGANQDMSSSDPVEAGHASTGSFSTIAEGNEDVNDNAEHAAPTPEPPSLNDANNTSAAVSVAHLAAGQPLNADRPIAGGDGGYIEVTENAEPETSPPLGSGGNNNGDTDPRLAESAAGVARQDALPGNGIDNPMYRLPQQLDGAPDQAPQQNGRRNNGSRASMPLGHGAYEDADGSYRSVDYDYELDREDEYAYPMTTHRAASSTEISASCSNEEIKIRGHFTADAANLTSLWDPIAELSTLDTEQLTALKGPTGLPLHMPEGMTYSLKKTDANNKFNAELKGKAEIEPKFISTIVNMIDNLLLQSTETPHEVSINSTDDNFKTIALEYLKILQDEKSIEINCTLDGKQVDFNGVQVTHLNPHKDNISKQSNIEDDWASLHASTHTRSPRH